MEELGSPTRLCHFVAILALFCPAGLWSEGLQEQGEKP